MVGNPKTLYDLRKIDADLRLICRSCGRRRKGANGQPIMKHVTNVRNLTSPFWKSTIGKPDFRCLVPVTDFCEWEGETGAKQERWFSMPSRPIFAFA